MKKQKTDEGYISIATKVPVWVADLLTILAKMRGMEVYELLQLLVNAFISAAKNSGPVTPEMRLLVDTLKVDAAWSQAFNFASPTAQNEIAQMVLILQQRDKRGFGAVMIDKPFMGEPVETRCVDDILERIIKVSMPGLYKKLDKVGKRLYCDTMRETLTLLSEYMNDSIDREEEQQEMPGYGENHDYGKAIEYGHKFKRKPHRTPDSVANSQQRIVFDDFDRDIADMEIKDWEGEQHDTR